MTDGEDELADAVLGPAARKVPDRAVATVTATSPLTVEVVPDHPEPAHRATDQHLLTGDRVVLLRIGSEWVVLGRLQ